MATAKTKLPNPSKPTKSAKKSAATLTKKATSTKTASKVKAAEAKADVKDAARDVKSSAKATAAKIVPINREDVSRQIETLKNDLADLTKTVKESGGEYVSAKTATLRAEASQKAELAKDKYSELAADTEARIRQNPLTAVAIAAGVGLLFGALSRR